MSALGWAITLAAMAVGLAAVAAWIADVGAPIEPETERCGAVHPVNATVCVRGIDHEVIDVHRDVAGNVWFDGDDDPVRSCVDNTDWEGRPWLDRP